MTQQAAQLFDTWANAGRGESMAKGHWPMVSQILDRMELQPGMACVDVGCGNGYAVRAMAERVGETGSVLGVDVAPAMIERATAHPENPRTVRFQVSAADHLPVAEDSMDRILSVEAIYYLPDSLAALKEWYRILKPGGSVWIMVDYYHENKYSHVWGELVGLPMQLQSERQYRELLALAGFTGVFSKRLFNALPLSETEQANFKPGWGYESLDDVMDFRTQVGSLLVSGKKSALDIPPEN